MTHGNGKRWLLNILVAEHFGCASRTMTVSADVKDNVIVNMQIKSVSFER